MELSIEFKRLIKQALLDRYNIENIIMENVEQKDFIRYSLKGCVNNDPFVGSLNIAENKYKTYSFTITGWIDGNNQSFMNYILKDNIYINTINEINEFLQSNFKRPIKTVWGRFHIGTGDFSFDGKSFTNISMNINPSFRARIEIVPHKNDEFIENALLEYTYVHKESKQIFNYIITNQSTFYTSVDNMEIEAFKKMLVREYMQAHSTITQTPNLLSIEEFDILSYKNIIDYLIVQHMQEIN